MYQPGSDALTDCPDNAPDDDGEELMEPVDGFRADCPVVIFTGKVESWIFLGELLILLTVVQLVPKSSGLLLQYTHQAAAK